MKSYFIYRTSDGFIGGVVKGGEPHTFEDAGGVRWSMTEGEADGRTSYFDVATKQIKDRPSFTATPDTNTTPADGATKVNFVNLPDPVRLTIAGPVNDSFECTGGALSLTFVEPGEYTVKFSRFPYLDAQVVLHAT